MCRWSRHPHGRNQHPDGNWRTPILPCDTYKQAGAGELLFPGYSSACPSEFELLRVHGESEQLVCICLERVGKSPSLALSSITLLKCWSRPTCRIARANIDAPAECEKVGLSGPLNSNTSSAAILYDRSQRNQLDCCSSKCRVSESSRGLHAGIRHGSSCWVCGCFGCGAIDDSGTDLRQEIL